MADADERGGGVRQPEEEERDRVENGRVGREQVQGADGDREAHVPERLAADLVEHAAHLGPEERDDADGHHRADRQPGEHDHGPRLVEQPGERERDGAHRHVERLPRRLGGELPPDLRPPQGHEREPQHAEDHGDPQPRRKDDRGRAVHAEDSPARTTTSSTWKAL